MKLEVDGIYDIVDAISELPKQIQKKAARKGLLEIAKAVRDEAKARVPVKTGNLKSRIEAVGSKSKVKGVLRTATIVRKDKKLTEKNYYRLLKLKGTRAKEFKKLSKQQQKKVLRAKQLYLTDKFKDGEQQKKAHVYYAHFIEYGTIKQAAQPFLRPALKAVEPKMGEIMQTYVDDLLKEQGWS